ncbi:alkaline phosphatase [Cryptotermes secundus]|uniref:alkaline phosphatase n=1 Tax=Cryptotermes secundus TaxID=105785 RepID=UPI000CD7B5D8|nr:alkaline phosphatase [Cryptotermes secundus]XP_023712943.1 alkaline phosphatase [Cryptotermes secundus]XP_033608552.1 alkaline phosphatase [Cryptotermes secundus]
MQRLVLTLLASTFVTGAAWEAQERDFWYEEARAALRRRLSSDGSTGSARPVARNVILFVGDGMGLATITASRILRGQREGRPGEETRLAWEHFPAVALARTYNSDAQIGESSACATALLCGVKANFETVGLDSGGRFENCFSSFSSRVPSLFDWAQQAGKATGLVTNTRVTHATPAALFAHSPSRYWEDDGKVTPSARATCKDIARQLVEDEPGRHINVVLGGGRRHWLPKVSRDPEPPGEEGRRLDGRNLIADWLREKKRRGLRAEYVWNRAEMERVDPRRVDHLLGLFAYSHLDFEADRDTGPNGDPSLADMTRVALSILAKNPRGFLLFVEGGRIDHAHHYNNAYRALVETLALEAALLAALPLVDLADTLLVLTADHSHVMTLGGLATPRGNPILGIDSKTSDVDGLPYSTLLYGNGPGFSQPRPVPSNSSSSETAGRNSVHGSAVPRQWATHGGEDVPIYAQGPLASQLFSGSFDQSYIPHAIAYAACLGEHSQRCNGGPDNYSASDPGPAACSAPAPEPNPGVVRGGVVVASSVMADDSASPHGVATSRYGARNFVMFIAVVLVTCVVSYGFEVT